MRYFKMIIYFIFISYISAKKGISMNKLASIIILCMILLFNNTLWPNDENQKDNAPDYSYLTIDELENFQITEKSGSFSIAEAGGAIKAEGIVKNSQKNGDWKIFYEGSDGKDIFSRGEYRSDKKTGLWVYYYPNGKTRLKVNYRDGKLNGPIFEFSEDGIPLSEIMFKNNLKDGVYRLYYNNGNPKEISMYSKDKKEGTENLYYPNGKRSSIGQYKKGMKDGLWRYFDETGKRKSDGHYKKDEKTGKWRIYDENEKVVNTEDH